jgi:hypothetical protein
VATLGARGDRAIDLGPAALEAGPPLLQLVPPRRLVFVAARGALGDAQALLRRGERCDRLFDRVPARLPRLRRGLQLDLSGAYRVLGRDDGRPATAIAGALALGPRPASAASDSEVSCSTASTRRRAATACSACAPSWRRRASTSA